MLNFRRNTIPNIFSRYRATIGGSTPSVEDYSPDFAVSPVLVIPSYTGLAIDLEDNLGNTKSFYFDANGGLDPSLADDGAGTTISAWITANSPANVRVMQSYDQTGNNNHYVQTVFGDAPYFWNTSSTYKQDSAGNYVFFTDSDSSVHLTCTLNWAGAHTVLAAFQQYAFSQGSFVSWDASTTNVVFANNPDNALRTHFGTNSIREIVPVGTPFIASVVADATEEFMLNGWEEDKISDAAATDFVSGTALHWMNGGTTSIRDCMMQCLIGWESNQSVNMKACHDILNDVFKAYFNDSTIDLAGLVSGVGLELDQARTNKQRPTYRVVRSSDSEEMYIKFNYDGTLDTTGLSWFSNAIDDVTIVDIIQRGEGNYTDATQATVANQALIVDAGVLVTNADGDNVPQFLHDGVNESYYNTTLLATLPQPFTGMCKFQSNTSGDHGLFRGAGNNGRFLALQNNYGRVHFGTNVQTNLVGQDFTPYGAVHTYFVVANGSSTKVGFNGTSLGTINPSTDDLAASINIGARAAGSDGLDGHISCIYTFTDNQEANYVSLEATL